MILHPGPLLKVRATRFHRLRKMPVRTVACNCTYDPDLSIARALERMVELVSIESNKYIRAGEHEVRIWHGVCEQCDTCYWWADSMEWVAHLSDEQLLEVLLGRSNYTKIGKDLFVKPDLLFVLSRDGSVVDRK